MQKYQVRIRNLTTNPFDEVGPDLNVAIKELFKSVLVDSENLTLTGHQKPHYRSTKRGFYGTDSGGHDMAKVNPQEFIDSASGSAIEGTGRFFRDSDIEISPSSGGFSIDLFSLAEMQPYPNIKRGKKDMFGQSMPEVNYFLPQRPIMYYFRHGWVDPGNPKHHMKKRPFGERVANAGVERHVIGRFLTRILRSIGFKGG